MIRNKTIFAFMVLIPLLGLILLGPARADRRIGAVSATSVQPSTDPSKLPPPLTDDFNQNIADGVMDLLR